MNFSRIYFLFLSFVMMLLLGSVYAWGVFRVEVESVMMVNATLSGLPYMVSLVSYAFMMLVAGRWMDRKRTTIVIGGVLLFISGFVLSSLVTNIYLLTLTYGLLLGSGVGLLYGVPMYILQKTFSSHLGLFSGLILMGFGLSSTVMTPLIANILQQETLQYAFMTLAWIAIFVFALSTWPLLQKIDRVDLHEEKSQTRDTEYDKPSFRFLYIVFALSLISGLMIIGLSFRVGVVNYQFDEGFVTFAIAIFALLNGVSRPFFGGLVDHFGFFKVAFISLVTLVVSGVLSLLNGGNNPLMYAISFAIFWFGLGNWMALMPLSVQTIFPKPLFALLYGKLFTAYGLAAIIGTLFSGLILDTAHVTWPIYALIVVVNVTSLFLVLALRKRFHLRFFK